MKEKRRKNKFYLSADEWHKHLAQLCENGGLALLWQDDQGNEVEQGRREYARRYYMIHLYQAQEWERLCAILDAGQYGRSKIQFYFSPFAYAQDVALGQQAVTHLGLPVEEGIALLPTLWRYSLLHKSLSSQIDNYPDIAFSVMASLGLHQQAL